MKMDRDLDEILGEMRSEHRTIAAPEGLEAVLSTKAKQRGAAGARRLRAAWAWGFALLLLAAIAWTGAVWEARRIHEPRELHAGLGPTHPVPVTHNEGPPVAAPLRGDEEGKPQAPSATPQLSATPRSSAAPRRLSANGTRLQAASRKPARGNSLEQFVPLPVSEGLPPAAQFSVVRVRLRGSDLQQYGLEPPADAAVRTMLAEFVVGEDGLPRAIRIVQ
jgi:hypothetical protein